MLDQGNDFPNLCKPRTKNVEHVKDWSYLDAHDQKLTISMDHILCLEAAGLTIEMVDADFLCRRIAPMQNRKWCAWDFKNMADIMRLHTGLGSNLTFLQHTALCHQLFRVTDKFKLPAIVVPLCNNSAEDSILAMKPSCNAH